MPRDTSQPLHPFACTHCDKRFTRHENLKRHLGVHGGSSSIRCNVCRATFARADLRRRHVKRKHPEVLCADRAAWGEEDAAHDQGREDGRDVPLDASADADLLLMENILSSISPEVPAPASPPAVGDSHSHPSPTTPPATADSDPLHGLSPVLLDTALASYFSHVAHFFPFVHRGAFDARTAPRPLLLALVGLGLQYAEGDEDGANVPPLSSICFYRALGMLDDNAPPPTTALDIVTLQARILLSVLAIMYLCGAATSHGLKLHAESVLLARQGGLFNPLPASRATSSLDALWAEYARGESHKRTCYALYHVDAMLYHVLSNPRALSHLELRHDMPAANSVWEQETATAWAHRSLLGQGDKTARYTTAVRDCLSDAPVPETFASMDAYALSLVVSFILSSTRENSGWSTMSGQVCFERAASLQQSGRVLEPFVTGPREDPHTALTETMLRMSMIELLMWAPSHTSGVVETSLDSAIASALYLSGTQMTVTPDLRALLEGHIGWFLEYLEQEVDYAAEPPWVTMYAFRAVLYAWQLARGGHLDPIERLGLGDAESLAAWTRRVFARRGRWQAARMVVRCLDEMDVAEG